VKSLEKAGQSNSATSALFCKKLGKSGAEQLNHISPCGLKPGKSGAEQLSHINPFGEKPRKSGAEQLSHISPFCTYEALKRQGSLVAPWTLTLGGWLALSCITKGGRGTHHVRAHTGA